MNKYIKFDWKFRPDAIPRMVAVDENTIIDNEFIRSFDCDSDNKIVKAYTYDPAPQYLILSLTNLLNQGNAVPTLIVSLCPTLAPKEDGSSAILKIFGLCRENEFVYDVIRATWQGYWQEQDNSLFFSEYAVNKQEGEIISVLELLLNIFSTYHANVLENESEKINPTRVFFEN